MGTRGDHKPTKHDSRAVRKGRRTTVLSAIAAFALGVLLAYQAITDIVEGNYVMGENYLGQPVGPGLQLVVCLVAVVVGVVMVWQYFHPKPPEAEGKKSKREKACYFKWPHDIP